MFDKSFISSILSDKNFFVPKNPNSDGSLPYEYTNPDEESNKDEVLLQLIWLIFSGVSR